MELEKDQDDSALEDARRLEFTLNIREDIVKKIFANGKIPEDKADKALLISALDGMDRTVLSKARIKADNKTADSNTQVASLIANLLCKVDPKSVKIYDDERTIPMLSDDVSKPLLISGETDIGTQAGSFDMFMKKFPSENN